MGKIVVRGVPIVSVNDSVIFIEYRDDKTGALYVHTFFPEETKYIKNLFKNLGAYSAQYEPSVKEAGKEALLDEALNWDTSQEEHT